MDKLKVLGEITTRNDAGRHFTEVYSARDLSELEDLGYIAVRRPVHEATGLHYSMEHWTVHVTDAGLEHLEESAS